MLPEIMGFFLMVFLYAAS